MPERECDVVMKGGVTSGVVYPRAIWELSRVYRFRNIGGTSAGAIAASLTAAAEYRRRRDWGTATADAGFDELRGLPQWLQQDEHLRRLFQPNRTTYALFNFLMCLALSQRKSLLPRIASAIFASAYGFPAVVAIVLTVLACAYLVRTSVDPVALGISLFAAVTAGVALTFGIPLGWAIVDLFRAVPNNRYGLCSGMSDVVTSTPPLTAWLADKIDAMAQRPAETPLTFGDLWRPTGASSPNAEGDAPPSEERDVNLEMVTTNVTYGRPFTVPFETDVNRFYFREDELRSLFPDRIVRWLKDHPRPPSADPDSSARHANLAAKGYYPLPAPRDIPVVVGARMSLSFPLLLSAVPLHGIDWALAHNLAHPDDPTTHRAWFSDGGLSSNFPLQFFDAPLPTRPTFGINLRAFDDEHKERPDEADNVWMPLHNNDLLGDSRNGFDDARPSLFGFLSAIVDTMQNWNDSLQSQVPGFRDRIVHVFLSGTEGGLNLEMPPDVLEKLTARGEYAGKLLIERYTSPSPVGPPQTVNWENHRWVRFRTATAMLQRFVADFSTTYEATPAGEQSYPDLVARPRSAPPFGYRYKTPEQTAFAVVEARAIAEAGKRWDAARPNDFANKQPHPVPELQVRARI
jgi:hypothetical protein